MMDKGLRNLLNQDLPDDVQTPTAFDIWLHASLAAAVGFNIR